MASEPIYTFDQAGMEALVRDHRRLFHQVQNLLAAVGRAAREVTAPGCYVAKTPNTGIPAADGDEPGEATCEIYAMRAGELKSIGSRQTVKNADRTDVAGATYVNVSRDAWGDWWVIAAGAPAYIGLTGVSGISARVGSTPGNGSVTIYARLPGGTIASTGTTVTVYNADDMGVSANKFVTFTRDAYGEWWIIAPPGPTFAAKTKAGGISARSGDTPGDGDVTLYTRNSIDGSLDSIGVDAEVFNLGVAIEAATWCLVHRDPFGVFWVIESKSRHAGWGCQFTLDTDLGDDDANCAATPQHYWGGPDPGANITVTNHETSGGAGEYIFSGAEGAWGTALWDDVAEKWRIIQMECPESQ